MKNMIRLPVVVAWLLFCIIAHAAPVLQVNADGVLTGAKGIDVADTLYDVEFKDGTCISLFSGCDDASDLTFQDDATAFFAAQVLLNSVLMNQFDTNPALTFGCVGALVTDLLCEVLTPFAVREGGVAIHVGFNYASGTNFINSFLFPFDFDTGVVPIAVYALWSLAAPTGAIPEPSIVACLGLGLLALVACRSVRR